MALSPEKQERLQEQLKELKEGIAIARGKVKEDADKQKAEVYKSVDEAAAKVSDFNTKTIDRVESDLHELSRNADVCKMVAEIQIDEDTREAKGDLEAARENVRIAKEYKEGKRNSALLKARMSINEIKARRAERLTEMDKEDRALYVGYLLDYAEDCQNMAEAFMLEAELALSEAISEIDAYEKDYGESL